MTIANVLPQKQDENGCLGVEVVILSQNYIYFSIIRK